MLKIQERKRAVNKTTREIIKFSHVECKSEIFCELINVVFQIQINLITGKSGFTFIILCTYFV